MTNDQGRRQPSALISEIVIDATLLGGGLAPYSRSASLLSQALIAGYAINTYGSKC